VVHPAISEFYHQKSIHHPSRKPAVSGGGFLQVKMQGNPFVPGFINPASLSAEYSGGVTNPASISLYTSGDATNPASISLYTSGDATHYVSTSLYTSGDATNPASTSLYTSGDATNSVSISIYTSGDVTNPASTSACIKDAVIRFEKRTFPMPCLSFQEEKSLPATKGRISIPFRTP